MNWLHQHRYWWVEALLGVAAIFAPFAAHLPSRPLPTLFDVSAGILLLGWACFGAWHLGYEASLGAPAPQWDGGGA